MELKKRIEKILKEKDISPEKVLDLGCGIMPYSDLFPNSKIEGFDINQNIKLHFKLLKNPNITFNFQNFNFKQDLPKGELVIASLVLHFIKTDARENLLKNIGKSDYLLIAHLDNKLKIPEDFELIAEDEFNTEKEVHDNLPEHSHHIFIELYKTKNTL